MHHLDRSQPTDRRAWCQALRHTAARGFTGLTLLRDAHQLALEMIEADAIPSRRLTSGELEIAAEFTRRGPQRHHKLFLEAEIVSTLVAARGRWLRGVTGEHRPRSRRARVAASRRGPPRKGPDEPPPLTRLRGFAVASARMIVHLERRRGALRIARSA